VGTNADDWTATRGLPFQRWEIHEVDFLEPDENIKVFHTLNPEDPNQVGYMVMTIDGGGIVYDARGRDTEATWTRKYVVLRTSRAPSHVLLLLVLWWPGLTR
jgi:hypothetical protein